MTAKGIRLNNPGNIRKTDITWDGEDPSNVENVFETFKRPWWGIRALAVLLRNYQRKHGLNTVQDIIGRWAPPSDNNPTSAYADFVADHLGVAKTVNLGLEDYTVLRGFVEAIIEFENGNNPYTWEVTTGLILAGVEPAYVVS